MKRTIALLLAILMLAAFSGASAQDQGLDWKLKMQLLNGSGLKGTADFTLTPGLKMTALDDTTYALLSALLPGAALEVNYIRGVARNIGQEDVSLLLRKDQKQLADLHYTTDGTLEALNSSLFGTSRYASSKGDGIIASLLLGQPGRWPGMERILYALATADNAWNFRAEAALKPYSDALSLWLQAFTTITSGKNAAGQTITGNTVSIPADALKREMKQLLAMAYQDTTLMPLLKEQLTAREAAAYLQPSMLPALSAAIDALPVTQGLTVTRNYDSSGAVVLDDIRLPLGGTAGVEDVRYRFTSDGTAQSETLIELKMAPRDARSPEGDLYSLRLLGGSLSDAQEGAQTSSYTGSLKLKPEAQISADFTVATPAPVLDQQIDFTLFIDFAREVVDQTTKASTRDYEITLLLKPISNSTVSDQSISLKVRLASGADSRSATKFTGSLIWLDQGTQATFTANISGASTAPWAIPTVAGTGALRLDTMTSTQLAVQKSQLQAALQLSLITLSQAFLVP
jgi:hypothetical protein